jgi:hypothetical protein
MTEFIKQIRGPFESSTGTTHEWMRFFNMSRSHFRRVLKDIATKIEMHRGHFYFSGFFTRKSDGKIFYFSCDDVRFKVMDSTLLIRTAVSYEDYTGGRNNFIKFNEDFENNLINFIKEC